MVWAAAPLRASSFFPEAPFSAKAAGTTSAAFLKAPPGARAQALGGAVSASAAGVEAFFWNPAGLSGLEAEAPAELGLSYNALLESSYSGAAVYARPYGKKGVLAFGLMYFSQSAMTSYNNLGDPTGSFAPSDLALGAGYARRFERVHAGGTLKLIRSSIDDVSGLTAALDAGVRVQRITTAGDAPVDFGAGFSNLGPPLKIGSSAPLPLSMRAGLLWRMTPLLHPSLDVHLPVDQASYVSLGLEALLKGAALRLGYNQNQGREVGGGLPGLTAGAGLDLGKFRLDYAWVPFGDLGTTNRLSLVFRF